MKFRGKMVESACMRQFSTTIAMFSRLGKQCVMRLTENHVYFIISDSAEGVLRPVVWCKLQQQRFFSEYSMVGVTIENNEIYLEFSSEMLSSALKSLRSSNVAKSIKIKLTNKSTPCLTCEIELPTSSHQSRMCTHDVPVEVIPRRQWSGYVEPTVPEFNVCFEMPNLKQKSTVCDRMKALGQHILVAANHEGAMVFKVEAPQATVTTHFKDIIVEDKDDFDGDPEKYFKSRVDSKKLSTFLSIDQVLRSKLRCSIVNKRLLHMEIFHEDMAVQYFIPAVAK